MGPRNKKLIIIINCVPMEAFFINLPSTPKDGDKSFLKVKQTAEVILFHLLLNDSLLQEMHNRCSLFFLQ